MAVPDHDASPQGHVAATAALGDFAPVGFREGEIAEQFRARQIGRYGFKANARMSDSGLRERELKNLFHPLSIGA